MNREIVKALLAALRELAQGYEELAQKIHAAEDYFVDKPGYGEYLRDHLRPLKRGEHQSGTLSERIGSIRKSILDLEEELSRGPHS
jgi:hypothetical protein